MDLDTTDRKILRFLASSTPNAIFRDITLADKAEMSRSGVLRRLRRLEAAGVVQSFQKFRMSHGVAWIASRTGGNGTSERRYGITKAGMELVWGWSPE